MQRTGEGIKKELATKLKLLLLTKKLSQADVARALNIPVSSLNSWIRGVSYPGAKNLAALENYFGTKFVATPTPSTSNGDYCNLEATLKHRNNTVAFGATVLSYNDRREIYNMISNYLAAKQGDKS